MTCKAILKKGKNKGNLCTYKAKFGKYWSGPSAI